jgi:hypothetical protein
MQVRLNNLKSVIIPLLKGRLLHELRYSQKETESEACRSGAL